ncbi:protein-L-isoaspartate O-methyltransferase family protein [Oricola sp.]|uniref:protein-L-isoaspartate O-methyltransferase family protein n=1 Tax=Oricola sp. TaxID=1979950 RepID=UPI003BABB8C7
MGQKFAQLRQAMVDSQVRTTDVTDLRLIEALLDVPREAFAPEARKAFAYIDDDIELPTDGDAPRYLMEPSPFARLVQLAGVHASDLVLDIGCGTGYSSAVLSKLGNAVIAVECDEGLSTEATEILSENGFDNVAVISGDLASGCASEGPYDVVFLGGAVDDVPEGLLAQVKDGGRLVAVVGRGSSAYATVFTRNGDNVSSRRAFNLGVKPLPGFQREAEFAF